MKLLIGDKTNNTLRLIYDYLLNNTSEQTIWLEGRDIVNEVIIHDQIAVDTQGVRMKWNYQGTEITPDCISGVINLLSYLPLSLFDQFVKEDQEYAREEFTSYLLFSLNQFKNVINPPWGGSLSGYCHSLPYQWMLTQKITEGIQVPKSFFGFTKDAPVDLYLGLNSIVSDNAFNSHFWKTGLPKSIVQDNYYLFYQRPPGTPFVIIILDNNIWIHPLGQDINHSNAIEELREGCQILMKHYHLRLAEILFFYDEHTNSFTFGSINPSVDVRHLSRQNTPDFLKSISIILENK
ncbi:hypothetical protein ACIQYG_24185 [Peribacillus sp. NPDC096622]|uniref:hypothetical protein n=1 Tax=Peribacillus sp. NPDC096622 TaxID=3364396 RepID=UPI0038095AFC